MDTQTNAEDEEKREDVEARRVSPARASERQTSTAENPRSRTTSPPLFCATHMLQHQSRSRASSWYGNRRPRLETPPQRTPTGRTRRSNRVARRRYSWSSDWQPWGSPADQPPPRLQPLHRRGPSPCQSHQSSRRFRCGRKSVCAMARGRSGRHTTPGGNCSSTTTSPSTSGDDSRARPRQLKDP